MAGLLTIFTQVLETGKDIFYLNYESIKNVPIYWYIFSSLSLVKCSLVTAKYSIKVVQMLDLLSSVWTALIKFIIFVKII